MRHLLEYNSFHRRGTNPNDILGWGDQIKASIQKELVGKEFKGYKIEKVEIKNPESFSFADDEGAGTIQLFCKKENPSELDQLISDLSTVGLANDKVQEIRYTINADLDSSNMYIITCQISPSGSPTQRRENNFLDISYKKFHDDSFDPSYGVGGIISKLIRDQIS